MVTLRLNEVAELVGGRCVGDPGHLISGIAPVDESAPDQIAYLAAERYVQYAAGCSAAAFLVSEDLLHAVPSEAHAVVVDDPYPALQRLLVHLHPDERKSAKIHPTAVIEDGVLLGTGVTIGPYAVLEPGVTVGNGSRIGPHVVLGAGTTVGSNSNLHAHVVTYHDTVIGDDVQIQSGARLGADGFGYTVIDGEHRKIPHVGRVIIGDGVEIGANTTIDRGSLGNTRVGHGVKIDNLVHIAHNVRIGARSLVAALVGIAGSTRVGEGVWFGGQSGAINQLEIGDGARITVKAGVTSNVPAGETMFGFPARPHWEGLQREASVGQLPKLKAQVAELEARVSRLSEGLESESNGGE
ncbi:MAG: UDP-3-O-(3-hydroxymyristoyl)glucosamine N-acyltransferase [Longimicrobiales bacterium]